MGLGCSLGTCIFPLSFSLGFELFWFLPNPLIFMHVMFQYELHAGRAPFQSYDPTGTAKKILAARISCPSKFSSTTQSVIKSLLNKDPTRRLGCMNDGTDGVMRHRFYTGFDWQGLLDKTIKPPYKPNVPSNIEKLGSRDRAKDKTEPCKWNPTLE